MDGRGDSAHCSAMKGSCTRIAAALLLSAAVAACVPATVPPAPLPAPGTAAAPQSAPAAIVPTVPRTDNWADAPQTPGTWRYGAQNGFTEAVFVGPDSGARMRLRCLAGSGMMQLSLPESGTARPLVTIRTHTATRTLEAQLAGRETLVMLTARDGVLDAMAFARGRFAVEGSGLAPLYLPSWPEVARVIEDCR